MSCPRTFDRFLGAPTETDRPVGRRIWAKPWTRRIFALVWAVGLTGSLPTPSAIAVEGANPAREARLEERNTRAWEAHRLLQAGKRREAVRAADRMLEVEGTLFAPEDEDRAGALEFAARVFEGDAAFERARDALRQALAVRERAQGKDHWQTVDTRYALERMGRLITLDPAHRDRFRESDLAFMKAATLGNYRAHEVPQRVEATERAVALVTEAVGEEHPELARALDRLADVYRTQAGEERSRNPRFRRVLETYEKARAIRARTLGEDHPEYALSLENLNWFAAEPGQAEGEPERRLRLALEIRRKVQGAGHPECARDLALLGQLAERRLDGRRDAIACYEESLTIRRRAFGDIDVRLSNDLTSLARLLETESDWDRVEALLREALAIARARVDGDGTLRGNWISTLGTPLDGGPMGWIFRFNAGGKWQQYALALQRLASFHAGRGDWAGAGQDLERALDAYAEGFRFRALLPTGVEYDSGSSQPHTLALRAYLDLSFDPRAEISAGAAYRQVLFWKGAYLTHERRARRLRADPEIGPLVRALESDVAELARLALAAPAPEDRAAWDQIAAVTRRKDEREVAFFERAAQLESRRGPLDAALLRARLPADGALVDFQVYFTGTWASARVPQTGYRILAFVVRPNGPVVRLDLGSLPPVEGSIATWLAAIERGTYHSEASTRLRELIWSPLEPHLAGSRVILIAPDEALGRVPWAALAGPEPGTYLIERYPLAVLPVPRLLLEDDAPAPVAPPGLLAVGGVDFEADGGPALAVDGRAARGTTGRPVSPRSRLMRFPPLAGTASEVAAVRSRFTAAFPEAPVTLLVGADATEGTFRRLAIHPRFIHLATHGFYRPPELASRTSAPQTGVEYFQTPQGLTSHSPGLLAGVAFAGANRAPRPDRDDGILSAAESQQLDLDGTELVVLSACETALGQATHSEGLMGLQRALQVAGVRSIVTSLWRVDDAATSAFMAEFYTNLWTRRLPKIEALRQTQIAFLREYDPKAKRLLRGEEVDRPEAPLSKPAGPPRVQRASPYYWAAFILGGDWR